MMTARLAVHKPREAGDKMLVTRRAAAYFVARHVNSVRRFCSPVACDVQTRADLYDMDEVADRFPQRVA